MDSHEETIRQKVTIILDHFVQHTSKKIDGRGPEWWLLNSKALCLVPRRDGETDGQQDIVLLFGGDVKDLLTEGEH